MKESQRTEWKESWRDDHLRWVCGFANAEGGVLVIGRDDKGRVVGIADAARLLEELPNKIRDLLGIVVEVNLRAEGDREFLEVVTPAYPTPISYRGRYYQRSGSTLQELKGAALDRFLLRRYGRTWVGSPIPGVTAADLSTAAFTCFRQMTLRSGRLDAAALAEPDAGLLERLKLTEGSYLKRAAVLLFHADPLRFVTGAFMKIGFFRSPSDLVYHDEVTGDLFSQSRQSLDLLLTKYLKAAISYEGIQRIERFPVPRSALREAVLNALLHRDYMVGAPIQIRVYENRLILWNPAVLPEGWTAETLRSRHVSHPFNPELANVFFRAGEIEAWGRGIEQIFQTCRDEAVPEPQVTYEANGLWMEFPFADDYLRAVAPGAGHQAITEPGGKSSWKSSGKSSGKTEDRILAMVTKEPGLSIPQMAAALNITPRAVEKQIRQLKATG
ncbi:MAG: winged helix-turn-helix transcriptional regulator, partial [Deltaproteobacteria bacterium]|nr:winged helix-turn-helix transcriptional regulator [Deltaproteobacteria bacterium]